MKAPIRLTHITFGVPDIDEAVAFFSDYFNFAVALDRRILGGSTVWLSPHHDGARPPFVLVIYRENEPANKLDHLGLQCDSQDDFALLHGRFKASTWDVSEIVVNGNELGSYFEITGPGGHHIEVTVGQNIAGI